MEIEFIEENSDVLPEYEKISIAFEVKTYFRVELSDKGLGGVKLIEETTAPYIKDYDDFMEDRPTTWPKRFDIAKWGVLSAFAGGQRVGGAAIAWQTPGVLMLDDRADLACLWDLRIAPGFRGLKIGQGLFSRAVDWARRRNCRQLKIETQNTNVPACRFYVRQGCELGLINRFAYPEALDEVQLGWYLNI